MLIIFSLIKLCFNNQEKPSCNINEKNFNFICYSMNLNISYISSLFVTPKEKICQALQNTSIL